MQPTWNLARSIEERISGVSEFDHELGDVRFASWENQNYVKYDPLVIANRLSGANATVDDLKRALGEPLESLNKRFDTPDYYKSLETIFDDAIPNRLNLNELNGFEKFLYPWLNYCNYQINLKIDEIVHRGKIAVNLSKISKTFPAQTLLQICTKTLIYELNLARFENRLKGDSAGNRFEYFCNSIAEKDQRNILLSKYPVLASKLTAVSKNWIDFQIEILDRLEEDFQEIREIIIKKIDNFPMELSEISVGAGDTHKGGRTVAILIFDNIPCLLYKPRNLDLEDHFKLLIDKYNVENNSNLKVCNCINKREYGWVEFINKKNCLSIAELKEYYSKIGEFLCIFHALAAEDMHYENIIAVGPDPYFVDLEALYHPTGTEDSDKIPFVSVNALKDFENSVVSTGLLPAISIVEDEDGNIKYTDMSGLGDPENALTPSPVLTFDGLGTDNLRIVRKTMKMAGSNNSPIDKEIFSEVKSYDFADEIITGFQKAYKYFISHKNELASDNGLLNIFSEDKNRSILRATRLYTDVLDISHHPEYMKDALDRDKFLSFYWTGNRFSKNNYLIAYSEWNQTVKGDIPIFEAKVSGKHIIGGDNTLIPDYYSESGLDRSKKRILDMTEDSLKQQIWIIKASLAATTMSKGDNWNKVPLIFENRNTDTNKAISELVNRYIDWIESQALQDDLYVGWLGFSLQNEISWQLGPVGIDFYNGLSGMGFSLAYIGSIYNDNCAFQYALKIADTIKSILQKYFEIIDSNNGDTADIGLMGPLGGSAYFLAHLGSLTGNLRYIEFAVDICDRMLQFIEKDEQLDIVSGSAGAILVFTSVAKVVGFNRLQRHIQQAVDRISSLANYVENGVYWITKAFPESPLTGFSHGSAGISYSLFVASKIEDIKVDDELIDLSIQWEDDQFSDDLYAWPDYREKANDVSMNAWCHGAPGILMSRIRMQKMGYKKPAEKLDKYLDSTYQNSYVKNDILGSGNYSLCHGDGGNIIALSGQNEFSQVFKKLSHAYTVSVLENGFICGIPGEFESPGLMTGVSGIIYSVMYLNHDGIPNVLLGDAPSSGKL